MEIRQIMLKLVGTCCLWLVFYTSSTAQPFPRVNGAEAQPGRLVVKLQPGYQANSLQDLMAMPGLANSLLQLGAAGFDERFPSLAYTEKPIRHLKGIFTLTIDHSVDLGEAAARLSRYRALFQYVEPDYLATPFMPYVPNDLDSAAHWFAFRMRTLDAWGLTRGNSTFKVGLVDTGVDYLHPDLAGNHATNSLDPVDGIDNDNNGYVDDFLGWDVAGTFPNLNDPDGDPFPPFKDVPFSDHGTFVAGHAAATSDNGTGKPSPAFNCQFVAVKCTPDSQQGGARIFNGYDGMLYAAEAGCQVINASWGSFSFSQLGADVVREITQTYDALIVAAAGNDVSQPNVAYPAAYPEVMAVTASGASDQLALNLTRGFEIDVASPASGPTTRPDSTYFNDGVLYSSFASATAAGAAILLRSYRPGLSARQVRALMRVTADPVIYNLAPADAQDKYGRGRIDLFDAMVLSTPALEAEDLALTDPTNNILESGDTVWLTGRFVNLLADANALTINLVSRDTSTAKILSGSLAVGALPNLDTVMVAGNSLQVVIPMGLGDNVPIVLEIQYQDGLYRDKEFITFIANPTFQTLDNGFISASVASNGAWGYADYPVRQLGVGFLADTLQTLFEGGLLIGTGPQQVSDNIRLPQSGASTDFRALERIETIDPAPRADIGAVALFSDSGAANPLGVQVRQETFGYLSDGNQGFLLNRVILTNTNFTSLTGLRVGQFADFDIGEGFNDSSDDTVAWWGAKQLLYTYGDASGLHVGLAMLRSPNGAMPYAGDASQFAFTDSAKWESLQGLSAFSQLPGVDGFSVLSTRGFNLSALASDTIVFAWLVGNNLAQLAQQADQADLQYACQFERTPLQVILPADTSGCDAISVTALATGPASFGWSTGVPGPTATLRTSGVYEARASTLEGCVYIAETNVFVQPQLNPDVRITPKVLGLNAPDLTVADATAGATAWEWTFGDGFGFQGPAYMHTYQDTGTYVVELQLSGGLCDTTVSDTVRVVPFVVGTREGHTSGAFQVYPNPASGRLVLQGLPLGAQEAKLVNPLGHVVARWPLSAGAQPLELNLPYLPSGLYELLVETHTGQLNKRIIIR